LDVKIERKYSLESQFPCDIEFTFTYPKKISIKQIHDAISDESEECHLASSTINFENKYDGNTTSL